MAAVAKPSDPEKMEVPAAEEETGSDREESMGEDEEQEEFTVVLGTTYSCKRQDGTYHDAKVLKTRMNKRAGREEFYVHYVGLNGRHNEWVDKTRLVLIKEEEEEEEEEEEAEEEEVEEEEEKDELNETNEEVPENGKSPQEEKSEEYEPQPKKIKVEVHEAPASSSVVAPPDDLSEDLTCLLCSKLFNDPVVVECGHNFCRSCIDKAWEGQESFTCPDCKEVITEKRYTNNRILANLVKKSVGASPAISTPAKEKAQPTENCLVHDERLKLFCKDDGDLGCVICRESLKHANHNFLPILDAAGVYREELSTIVNPLEEALKVAEELAKQQSEKIENHRVNMKEYREHIESEFEKMHRFLKQREEQLLGKLQEEGGSLLMEMEANISKMQENIDNIKKSMATASEKLADSDAVSFLTDIKAFIKKCEEQQKEALSSGNSIIDKQLSRETYMAPIDFSMSEDTKIAAAVPPKPKEIWIIGNFWVTHAAQVARQRPYGKNLGLEEERFTIRWMDKYDLLWRQLLPDLNRAISTRGEPSIVFIHLGSSDLGQVKLHKLISNVQRDLDRLVQDYSNTTFIWSAIMPRKVWLNTFLEGQRKKFNSIVSRYAELCGVKVAPLIEVETLSKEHLRYKGRHALEDVADIFNRKLMDSLETAINQKK